jgi:FkbM family methyltransferase
MTDTIRETLVTLPGFTGFNLFCQTRYGPMLCNKHDAYVGASVMRYGEFSEGEAALFRHLIPVGGVVIEAGSNIGALTVPIAQHVGVEGRVFAYEPQRLAFQLLNANVALNSLTNVVTKQVALGAGTGHIRVPFLDPNATNNIGGVDLQQDYTGYPVETVPVVKLDDLPLRRLDFLKADVEGMEVSVLTGARDLIHAHKPILYLEADRQDLLQALAYTLQLYGYPLSRAFVHAPPLYNPDNFNGKQGSIFVRDDKEIVSINWLCFHADLEEIPDLTGIAHLVPWVQAYGAGRQEAA